MTLPSLSKEYEAVIETTAKSRKIYLFIYMLRNRDLVVDLSLAGANMTNFLTISLFTINGFYAVMKPAHIKN